MHELDETVYLLITNDTNKPILTKVVITKIYSEKYKNPLNVKEIICNNTYEAVDQYTLKEYYNIEEGCLFKEIKDLIEI